MVVKNNYVLIMRTYDKAKYFAALVIQVEKGRIFSLEGIKFMSESMIILNVVAILFNTTVFHQDI